MFMLLLDDDVQVSRVVTFMLSCADPESVRCWLDRGCPSYELELSPEL
jgi:hypothetical protein